MKTDVFTCCIYKCLTSKTKKYYWNTLIDISIWIILTDHRSSLSDYLSERSERQGKPVESADAAENVEFDKVVVDKRHFKFRSYSRDGGHRIPNQILLRNKLDFFALKNVWPFPHLFYSYNVSILNFSNIYLN